MTFEETSQIITGPFSSGEKYNFSKQELTLNRELAYAYHIIKGSGSDLELYNYIEFEIKMADPDLIGMTLAIACEYGDSEYAPYRILESKDIPDFAPEWQKLRIEFGILEGVSAVQILAYCSPDEMGSGIIGIRNILFGTVGATMWSIGCTILGSGCTQYLQDSIPCDGTDPIQLNFFYPSTAYIQNLLIDGEGKQHPDLISQVTVTPTQNAHILVVTMSGLTYYDAPIARFTADKISGLQPLYVAFTDISYNNPTSWFWNFGDGKSSNERNPVHVFDRVGTFPVQLTVQNTNGADIFSMNIVVDGLEVYL